MTNLEALDKHIQDNLPTPAQVHVVNSAGVEYLAEITSIDKSLCLTKVEPTPKIDLRWLEYKKSLGR